MCQFLILKLNPWDNLCCNKSIFHWQTCHERCRMLRWNENCFLWLNGPTTNVDYMRWATTKSTLFSVTQWTNHKCGLREVSHHQVCRTGCEWSVNSELQFIYNFMETCDSPKWGFSVHSIHFLKVNEAGFEHMSICTYLTTSMTEALGNMWSEQKRIGNEACAIPGRSHCAKCTMVSVCRGLCTLIRHWQELATVDWDSRIFALIIKIRMSITEHFVLYT